jgi:hypothetical protein
MVRRDPARSGQEHDMHHARTAACLVLRLAAGAAWAADPPETAAPPDAAEQKRLLQLAYRAAHARGVCDVYLDFARWQAAHWPEGKAAREQFLTGRILPNYVAAAGPEKSTPDQLEAEYRPFCEQSGDLYDSAMDDLRSEPDDPMAAQRQQVADSLEAGRFLGQCQTVSALYLQGDPEQTKPIAPFVRDEVYAKDERYRQDAVRGVEVDDILKQAKSNEARESQYWSDCDEAEAKLGKIAEQLGGP